MGLSTEKQQTANSTFAIKNNKIMVSGIQKKAGSKKPLV